jgi:GH35 family endo-1,4-beta-xylanase
VGLIAAVPAAGCLARHTTEASPTATEPAGQRAPGTAEVSVGTATASGAKPLVLQRIPAQGFRFGGGCQKAAAVVSVENQPFSDAIQLDCDARGKNPWDAVASFRAVLPEPVEKGDALLLTFFVRALRSAHESGQGVVAAQVAAVDGDWTTRSLDQWRMVGGSWQKIELPFAAKDSYRENGLRVEFSVGSEQQAIQIGGVELAAYGKQVRVEDLPKTRATYAGRGKDAPWRAEAERRIEQHRKGSFTLNLVDRQGTPVTDAPVTVKLVRHSYDFGHLIPIEHAVDSGAANLRFREKLGEPGLFSMLVYPNALKWPARTGAWSAHFSDERVLAGLRFIRESGFRFRGHVLIWPGWGHVPKSFAEKYRGKPANCAAMRADIESHIRKVTALVGAYVDEWDVINEPFHNHDLMDLCGKELMVEWFRLARKYAPSAKLAINEFGQIVSLADTEHVRHYQETIRYLLDNKAPLDVIGVQGHFGELVPAPTRVYEVLESLSRFKRPIKVTEFTMGGNDGELHADYMRDVLTMVFSHKGTAGFIIWGNLLDKEGNELPALASYRALLLGKWSTNLKLQTDAQGAVLGRGFFGDYQVGVTRHGRTTETSFTLSPETSQSRPVRVVVD